MNLVYEATLEDYKAAYRLLYRRSFISRYDYVIWPLVAILSGFLRMSVNFGGLFHLGIEWLFLFSALLAVGIPIVRVCSPSWGFRRNYVPARTSPESITEITPDSIVDVAPGVHEISYVWSEVIGFGQDSRVTLIRRKGSRFTFFPTSVLTTEQRTELDELVSRRGIRRWS